MNDKRQQQKHLHSRTLHPYSTAVYELLTVVCGVCDLVTQTEQKRCFFKVHMISCILMSISHRGSPQDVTSENEEPPSPPPDLQAS